ncbi:protein MEI2-like 4 [Impatiens glandulifera]|uniref:protein MEI2-like 4 n=1 Tax=Impatiens glandulifera TaxID=253017 RepID=UPI001FB09C0E|nr:protein MEI2-like 4 [Impatiens glandulifera]XP_047312413.1 protein MEI2-like 4 [Impatiens glandulifera]
MKIRGEGCTFAETMSSRMERNIGMHDSLRQMSPSSSSLPETFGRKLGLSTNNMMIQESIDEGDMGTTETLQNLLPDEDDLFSGMIDELLYNTNGNEHEDFDDFDLFHSSGGMELELDKPSFVRKSIGRVLNGLETCTGSLEDGSIHYSPSARYMSEFGVNKSQNNGRISITESTMNSSPVRMPSFGTCIGLPVVNHSLHQAKLCNGIGLMNPRKTSSNLTDMGGKTNDPITSNGNQGIEFHRRVPSQTRNGNCVASEQYEANNNLNWNSNSSAPMWPNSPLFLNDIMASYPQLSGHPQMPIDNLNKVSPPQYPPYVGSASSASWSLLDMKNAQKVGFPEPLGFSPGSFGNESPVSHPSLHLLGRDSYACSYSGGKSTYFSTTSNSWCNPHILANRTGLNSVPNSFDSAPKCVKILSRRRSLGGFPQSDSKQFELDIDRVLHGADNRTTLMIKNIPNKYTSKMLLAAIDEQCQGTYDFIYLPIDFKNNCNVGYAFINMIDPLHIIPFYKAFNGRKWDKFNSEKMVVLAYARIQGKNALIAHFQNSNLMNEDKRCRPILFCTDGPNAGEQESFPLRTSGRGKAGKAQSNFAEENENGQQASLVGSLVRDQTLLLL